MRIAYLTSQYPAPSHTFIRREIEALREAGVDVRAFSVRRPSEQELMSDRVRKEHDATWYVFPVSLLPLCVAHGGALLSRPVGYIRTLRDALKHRAPGGRELLWSLFFFAESILLARQLKRDRIEHVHNHFANSAATVGFLATRFLGIPWSVTLHGTSEFDYPAGLLLRAKIEHARLVACASYFVRAQAMRVVPPGEWEKMVVVRCGVALDQMPAPRSPSPQQSDRPASRLRLLTVGRLSPEKGQSGLLDAFRKVLDQGIDAELRIIGSGPLEQEMAQRIDELDMSDRCALLGRQPEATVLEELAQADIFVLSSLMEGLPVVLMESLAMRVPTVAPQVAGIPELVQHEQTGLLFAPSDWEGLAEQLVRMAKDAGLRARLIEPGRRKIEAEFDIQRAVLPLVKCWTR